MTGLLAAAAPPAFAGTCNQMRIWTPRPIGHHFLPTIEQETVECADCPPGPTHLDVQIYPSVIIITGCDRI